MIGIMVEGRRAVDPARHDAAPTTFSHLLRRYRRESGLTQEMLAEHSGISVRAIGDLERGVKHRPRNATVELLADALQLSGAQRAALRSSVSGFGGAVRGQPDDAARLPRVTVQPTYPLPASAPLVGRESVLTSILDTFPDGERVDGRAGFLLIVGDAGMGKTSLLAEIARQARERGLLVLAGGSYEVEGRLPLGALHDALLDYVEAQADEVLQIQLGGLLPDLARVLPELRDRFPDLPESNIAGLEEQRPRLFWTLSRVFERISKTQPLVLLLDDLQWADQTTIQLLHFLSRQRQLNQILIVAASRPGAMFPSQEPGQLLQGGTRGARLQHIDLQPIDQSGLAMLLGARLGGTCAPGLVTAVHERSAGNPFFALEILGLLRQEGRLERAASENGDIWTLKGGVAADLPAAVQDTVAQRLRGLEPGVIEVLQIAAVAGRQVSYTTLADLWEAGERSLLRAIDIAITSQVLEETEAGYGFRHPVLQEVVYRRLSAAHRAWLHARVAQSLEEMYGARADEHAGELAHHIVAGGKDGERALHYLTLAAEASARASAWEEALAAYRAALPYESTDQAVASLKERIGGVLKALGRYDDALAALDEAVALYQRSGDLQRVGAVTAALVQVHALRGSWAQGRGCATRVIGQIERLSPANGELARALADLYLALTYLYDVGLEQRLHDAERAAEIARALGDDGLLARAEMQRGFILFALRRFTEAQEVIKALIPVAEGVQDSSTLRFAVDIVADIHKLEGRFHACLRGRERALAYAEERPDEPHWIMVDLAQLGEAHFLLGKWPEARDLYRRAIEMSHVYPAPHYAAFVLLGLGALDLAEGRWEEATQLIETCIADAEGTNDVHWVRNAQRLLAHRDLLLGHPDEALRRLEDEGVDHTGTLYLRAWAFLELGDIPQSATLIERCIALARERNNHLDLCEALIVQARICSRQGTLAEAEVSFAEALSLSRSMPYPFAEGRTLYEWGRTLNTHGNQQQGRELLAQALPIFQRLGAEPYVDQTEQALRVLESCCCTGCSP